MFYKFPLWLALLQIVVDDGKNEKMVMKNSPTLISLPHFPALLQIVVDDGKNEKMVMKNAHEIAILSTLSHPHVTQV